MKDRTRKSLLLRYDDEDDEDEEDRTRKRLHLLYDDEEVRRRGNRTYFDLEKGGFRDYL